MIHALKKTHKIIFVAVAIGFLAIIAILLVSSFAFNKNVSIISSFEDSTAQFEQAAIALNKTIDNERIISSDDVNLESFEVQEALKVIFEKHKIDKITISNSAIWFHKNSERLDLIYSKDFDLVKQRNQAF